jgi:ComF family protein
MVMQRSGSDEATAPIAPWLLPAVRRGGNALLDLILPHRCAGCSAIVGSGGGFCPDCWVQLDFLSGPACARCDTPFEIVQGDGALCGACIADPPPYDRVHAPLAYGPHSRALVLRLKYGRRTGLARPMAQMIARVLPDHGGIDAASKPLLVPVPLHRWRLWSRGFNQSAEIARGIARACDLPLALDALIRTRPTAPLRGLGRSARTTMVRGAFAVQAQRKSIIAGRSVYLIDDVFTSGATAAACARTLRRAGASSVAVVAFTRVIDGRGSGDVIDSLAFDPDI